MSLHCAIMPYAVFSSNNLTMPALTLIAKLSILYETLSHSDQKELLRNVVERVVVNLEGEIERGDLLPPFAYLRDV